MRRFPWFHGPGRRCFRPLIAAKAPIPPSSRLISAMSPMKASSMPVGLLQTIAPGVDFRFDQAQWRQYFANQLVGSPGDLRRDP